jgi:hypothetical protein
LIASTGVYSDPVNPADFKLRSLSLNDCAKIRPLSIEPTPVAYNPRCYPVVFLANTGKPGVVGYRLEPMFGSCHYTPTG